MIRFKKMPRQLPAMFIAFACLLVYALTAFLILPPQSEKTTKSAEKIPYDKVSGDLCVLVMCDELSRYCGVRFDFDEKSVQMVLFDDCESAKNYGFSYDRTLSYDTAAAVNTVGRIGGLVFSCDNWYNDGDAYSFSGSRRLMGSQALILADDPGLREPLACEFLRTLLKYELTKSDFSYIISMCRTDISVPDYIKYWHSVSLCERITVFMG